MLSYAPNLTTVFCVAAAFQPSNADRPSEPVAWSNVKPGADLGDRQTNALDPLERIGRLALAPLMDALDEYLGLENGWEGVGTLAPSKAAIEAARTFLKSWNARLTLPDLSVGTDGEVNISWRDSYKFVDISFYDGTGGMMYARIGRSIFKVPSGVKALAQLPAKVVYHLIDA